MYVDFVTNKISLTKECSNHIITTVISFKPFNVTCDLFQINLTYHKYFKVNEIPYRNIAANYITLSSHL